jgi:hypothetical protein
MNETNDILDLIVLVADTDMEWTMRTLLEKRVDSLGIRSLRFEVRRHHGRDPGVFKDAHNFLRLYLRRARHALVLLDREGSGQEHRLAAQDIEAELERRLRQNGWTDAEGQPRATAIALDPELEIWVWSRSPHVAQVLGLPQAELQQVLENILTTPEGKPQRPKEAMLAALHRSGRPRSARIFQELAERVSLWAHERAFDKLRSTLQTWFAPEETR